MIAITIVLFGLAFPLSTPGHWQQKRVLITGASSGLGRELAMELHRRGARLVLTARREDRLHEVAALCDADIARKPAVMPLDVSATVDVLEEAVKTAETLLGGDIDCLVCAAGVGQRTSVINTSAEMHDTLMATNFGASVALTRAVLPSMLSRRCGEIVVISSVQGFFGQPFRSSYAASKAAVFGYFDALRSEVASSGIQVTTVAPGYIATEHAARALGGDGAPDGNSAKGVSPVELASVIADAVECGQPELVTAQLDARVAILLRTVWPRALFWLMDQKARREMKH